MVAKPGNIPPVSSSSVTDGDDDTGSSSSSSSSSSTVEPQPDAPDTWKTGSNGVIVPNGASAETIKNAVKDKKITTLDLSQSGLTSVDLSGCTSLQSITPPSGVTEVNLSGCSNLTNIGTIFQNSTSLETINLSNTGLTIIGERAFFGCTSLESITLPNGLTTIGAAAFSGCTKLTAVNLPDGLTTIEWSAFSGCASLKSIDLPASLTTIGAAFSSCARLTSVDLSKTQVTEIPPSMFLSCGELESVTLPASLTKIGDNSFQGCFSLTTIDLRNTRVNSIGEGAFCLCNNLSTVILPSSWDNVLIIEDGAFDLDDSSNGIRIYIPNANATAESFSVGEIAFLNCSTLTLYYNGTNKDNIKTAFTSKGVGEGKITVSDYPNLPTQQNLPGQQSLPAFFDFFS